MIACQRWMMMNPGVLSGAGEAWKIVTCPGHLVLTACHWSAAARYPCRCRMPYVRYACDSCGQDHLRSITSMVLGRWM